MRNPRVLAALHLAPRDAAPKVRWSFDPRNGAPLRASLELYIPKSEWNFSPYTGYAWTNSTQQYAPLNQQNQFPTQQAARTTAPQSAPHYSTSTSSAPLPFFPATCSGNYPAPLPLTSESHSAAPQSHSKKSNRSSSNVNAVHSAGRGAAQLFADVQLCDATINQALIDTGATFSMIPVCTIASLNNPPSVENFSSAPPRIVGVGGASATVRGYIDAPLVIAGARIQHPLIVVEELEYPLLIGIDILEPHDAQLGVGASSSIRLAIERCTVCNESRSESTRLSCPCDAAYVLMEITLTPCAATRVPVRLPSSILGATHFIAEPLPSSFSGSPCAALPSVNVIEGCTHLISVVNSFNKPVTLHPGMAIAAVSPHKPLNPVLRPNVAALQRLSH